MHFIIYKNFYLTSTCAGMLFRMCAANGEMPTQAMISWLCLNFFELSVKVKEATKIISSIFLHMRVIISGTNGKFQSIILLIESSLLWSLT